MDDALERSLAVLEQTLRQSGAGVASRLRPGLDEPSVNRLIGRVGLSPSAEIVTWFAWHDGADIEGTARSATWFAPGAVFFDLARLCKEYRDTRRDFDDVVAALPSGTLAASDLWNPSWFPLLRLPAGYVAVDLAVSSRIVSPVHVIWFDDEPEYRTRVLWPSLNAFVVDVLHRFEAGIYWVDRDGVVQGPDVDASS
jgi:cell wall assembly regulator SMI1